jgi:hypothetical protein
VANSIINKYGDKNKGKILGIPPGIVQKRSQNQNTIRSEGQLLFIEKEIETKCDRQKEKYIFNRAK